jgi:hypothetical protein
MKTRPPIPSPAQPNLEELTLGDFIRSQTPTFQVTLLAEKPSKPDPKRPYESYMVMPVQYFLNTYRPDDLRRREGGWRTLVKALKTLFAKELNKVW